MGSIKDIVAEMRRAATEPPASKVAARLEKDPTDREAVIAAIGALREITGVIVRWVNGLEKAMSGEGANG